MKLTAQSIHKAFF